MNWVTIIWSASAGACLMLGLTHLLIWLKCRTEREHLAFVFAALAVAGVATSELRLMETDTPVDYARMVRWIHVPIFVLVAAVVSFVGLYFRTGRWWLGAAVIGTRFIALGLNFVIPANLNYREITALRRIDFLGQPVSVVAAGVLNPLNGVGPMSSLLMALFVIDASVRLWRRGGLDHRRKSLVVGGSIVVFIVLATGHTCLVHAGFIQSPYLVSFSFLGIIAAMAHELSHELRAKIRLTKELLEAQQQIALAASAAKLVLWSWDIPKDLIWMTSEARSRYGFSTDEPISLERALSIIHPDDRESARRAIMGSLTSGAIYAAEYRVVLPDGTIRWIVSRGKVASDGSATPPIMSGVSIDTTDRKQAEERSRLVVEAAPNAMLMVDASARILLVNKMAESTFGYAREELLGQRIELLIPGRFSAGHPALHKEYGVTPEARPMGTGRELFGRRKDGTEVPVEIGLTPLVTSEGECVLASIIDITERKRAEMESMEQRDELFHLSRVASLGQLSGALAHELNQPLGIILSNAQAAQRMLAGEAPDIPELREILADIVSENRRAGEVITRLRVLLKRGETRLLPLALDDVIADVLHLLRSDLVSRRVTIQTTLADGLPKVPGDAVQLQQVLLNIILNACDAMAENPPADRILAVSTRRQPGAVGVSVRDHGCGLPDGDANRVFQPFYTTKSQGLGIGLSICRSIVVAHHGRLWAEPNVDRGTTLHMELPTSPTADP